MLSQLHDALQYANLRGLDWNCIQLTTIRAYKEVSDFSSACSVINIVVGSDSVGSFGARGALSSADVGIYISDAKRSS